MEHGRNEDRGNVYVTRKLIDEALAELRTRCRVDVAPQGGLDRTGVLEAVRGREAILASYLKLDAEIVAAMAPTCRIIACYGVGYDHVDVDAATRHGIWVTHNPGFVTEDTADLAFALLMGVARRLRESDGFVRSGRGGWGPTLYTGVRVYGKTLGIVGSGRIATALALRARGFAMRLLYTSRRRNEEFERLTGATYAAKEELLRTSDFVSLHVPLTEETRHWIGAAELAMMRPSAVLVNTARGPVVDERALVAALAEGRLAGAGLDVFEREPEVHEGLKASDRVLLCPHNGTATMEARVGMGASCAEKIFAALDGRVPPNCLNPEARAGK
ncbi:MAG: D-glycerate dehydrogenase [Desulfovibrionaceae bacterium]|jgi:lactate dehydrogenase-like 2-hydroxyacid dehydrogenase|nr:D-glycerate dehydrogenase [Desulfovibrionaceae bacterium]